MDPPRGRESNPNHGVLGAGAQVPRLSVCLKQISVKSFKASQPLKDTLFCL